MLYINNMSLASNMLNKGRAVKVRNCPGDCPYHSLRRLWIGGIAIIGGKMKKFVFATLALGAALAFIPSALADSLGYKSAAQDLNSSVVIAPGAAHFTNRVAESGAFAMSGMIATFSDQNAAATATENRPHAANAASKVAYAHSANGSSQFDSLLNFGNGGTGILDKGGVLVDISGRQMTLLSGNYAGNNRDQNNGHFFFADKGSFHPGNNTSGSDNGSVGRAPALTETPEPGSLILLGTGLLCMALMMFWKSARQPATSETLR